MMNEFWNEFVTEKSFEKLVELSKKYKFIVIGGWAAYLLTGLHKSKDIDLVVDYDTLFNMKKEYAINKNDRLKKYEIKFGEFDVDLYLPAFSRLMLPIKVIAKNAIRIKGLTAPKPEALVILKQGAEIDRRNTIKGRKDMIDIITILVLSNFDIGFYRKLLKNEKLEHLEHELVSIVKRFDLKDLKYLGMNVKEFSEWKKKFLLALR